MGQLVYGVRLGVWPVVAEGWAWLWQPEGRAVVAEREREQGLVPRRMRLEPKLDLPAISLLATNLSHR